jgi:two-component system cell cycle sensor histidine kinase/response regulator CckA
VPYPTEPGPYVQITVSDTGKGIPAEMLPHIFKPFVTTKAIGAGHGLGLVTVWSAAQRHRGILRVDSRPGEGSSFHLYLPRLAAPTAPGAAA